MGHIRLTGNTIEHDTTDSGMLIQNDAEKDRIVNAIREANNKLEEIKYVSKGVSDTTDMISKFIDENYKTYEELYAGGSPLVREFVRTVTTTFVTGPDNSYSTTTETGSDYREQAQQFVNRIKDDARLISYSIDEPRWETQNTVVDEFTQISTTTYKVVVTVEYHS